MKNKIFFNIDVGAIVMGSQVTSFLHKKKKGAKI